MDCRAVEASERPALPPEYEIVWEGVRTVAEARAGHETYVRSVRAREGVVTGHVVEIEGRLWACANDDAWLRDFFAKLPGETAPQPEGDRP